MTEKEMLIVVPIAGSRFEGVVLPGSGIVARAYDRESFLVDYEGNKYNASNLETWEDKVLNAADRARSGYATTARMAVPFSEVTVVGEIVDGEIVVHNQSAVEEWQGEDEPWATRFDETWRGDDGEDEVTTSHLVVVWAPNVDEAKRRSGLVMEEWHQATDDELDEWQDVIEGELDAREIATLASQTRRKLREVGRSRLKNRRRGNWSPDTPARYDADRAKARRGVVMVAKLEEMTKGVTADVEADQAA